MTEGISLLSPFTKKNHAGIFQGLSLDRCGRGRRREADTLFDGGAAEPPETGRPREVGIRLVHLRIGGIKGISKNKMRFIYHQIFVQYYYREPLKGSSQVL